MRNDSAKKTVAVLHGAGYAGRELIRILLGHPHVALAAITSRTFADKPIHQAHPDLRGATGMAFTDPSDLDAAGLDGVLIAAEHGKAVQVVMDLLSRRFDGAIVDLSADFRLNDPADYERWYGFEHPAPDLLPQFVYGMTELTAPYHTNRVANPGCFATGVALALRPLQEKLSSYHASITAITGASGSGTRPKAATHYPTRDGNIRAYKVLRHQHLPEVMQLLHPGASVSLVPASGPWSRGIWGSVHISAMAPDPSAAIGELYEAYYGDKPLVRLWPGMLPELRYAVGTPFCDIGWVEQGECLVIGFALDNLLKGAASQAIQNLNEVLGMGPAAGLLP